MSKINKHYLILTFSIMLFFWGICFVCGINGIFLNKYYALYIPYLLGGLSPTIASYIVLKKSGDIGGFKDWLKIVFRFKGVRASSYLAVVVFAVAYILPLCLVSGFENGIPIFFLPLLIPFMLIGGGLEEHGWRSVFQPELEKKFSFTLSTIITAVVWCVWHLPLFVIPGVGQYGMNFAIFSVGGIGLSFALASLRKNTNSVMLCVLLHCTTNALSGVFIVKENMLGAIVSAAALILLSYGMTSLKNKALRV
ncbi:CPBP family intramembrane metalloprotease [Clostridia bacterium]|nr:CPBP family intramembrane metalloprotease [Clostridia bacterium]